MNITLYTNSSPANKIGKDLTQVGATPVAVVLKNTTDIMDPTFTLSGVAWSDLDDVNYLYAPDLNRYYFVTDIQSVRNGVFDLVCHVDVLESYASEIRQQTAVLRRQENLWNLYLNDGVFKTYSNNIIGVQAFTSGFNTLQFVLAMAGG